MSFNWDKDYRGSYRLSDVQMRAHDQLKLNPMEAKKAANYVWNTFGKAKGAVNAGFRFLVQYNSKRGGGGVVLPQGHKRAAEKEMAELDKKKKQRVQPPKRGKVRVKRDVQQEKPKRKLTGAALQAHLRKVKRQQHGGDSAPPSPKKKKKKRLAGSRFVDLEAAYGSRRGRGQEDQGTEDEIEDVSSGEDVGPASPRKQQRMRSPPEQEDFGLPSPPHDQQGGEDGEDYRLEDAGEESDVDRGHARAQGGGEYDDQESQHGGGDFHLPRYADDDDGDSSADSEVFC